MQEINETSSVWSFIMSEQQYQAEVLDELKQLEYNIKLETEKGKYERAINDKCR